jgi:hypothetical protein
MKGKYMTCPENQRANGLTDKDLQKLRDEYMNASPAQRRAIEIRDLGYPLTHAEKTQMTTNGSTTIISQ